jgi:hypothetical protein
LVGLDSRLEGMESQEEHLRQVVKEEVSSLKAPVMDLVSTTAQILEQMEKIVGPYSQGQ